MLMRFFQPGSSLASELEDQPERETCFELLAAGALPVPHAMTSKAKTDLVISVANSIVLWCKAP